MKTQKIQLRFYKITDAKKVFQIVTNPSFKYFHTKVKSVKAEEAWIKANSLKRKNNIEWNYAVVRNTEIVGGVGVKIDRSRPYVGEIGYFVAEDYWGQGIATQAVKLLEKICFKDLKLSRIEILMRPENKASEKVARKSGYKKEGLLKKKVKDQIGKLRDVYIYAKVL